MRSSLLFAAFLFSPGALATSANPLGCFFSFATTAADDSQATSLVVATYKQLLEQLGGSKLSAATLAKLAANEDPFSLPEQPGTDLFALRTKLNALRKMVEAKGWNTPERRAAIRTELMRQVATRETSSTEVEEAVRKTKTDYVIDFPDHTGVGIAVSPNGRWVISKTASHAVPNPSQYIYDNVSRQLTAVPTAALLGWEKPVFTPDGKEVIYADKDFTLVRIPFHDGKLDVGAARSVGKSGNNVVPQRLGDMKFADNQRLYAGLNALNKHLTLFDLKQNTGIKIEMPEAYKESTVIDWTSVPGTKQIRVVFSNHVQGRADELVTLEIADDGKATVSGPVLPWNALRTMLRLGQDGKTVFRVAENGIDKWDGATRTPVYQPAGKDHQESIVEALFHPTESKALVVTKDAKGQKYVFDWVDLDSHEVLGSFKKDDFNLLEFKLSSDGEQLYAYRAASAEWLVINFHNHLGPK